MAQEESEQRRAYIYLCGNELQVSHISIHNSAVIKCHCTVHTLYTYMYINILSVVKAWLRNFNVNITTSNVIVKSIVSKSSLNCI